MATATLWKLDDLAAPQRRVQLDHLDDFVQRLRSDGVDVPRCWYTHGWLRSRLAIFDQWWNGITDPGDGNRWWSELFTLTATPLWREALDHGNRHAGEGDERFAMVPVAEFDDVVVELCSRSV